MNSHDGYFEFATFEMAAGCSKPLEDGGHIPPFREYCISRTLIDMERVSRSVEYLATTVDEHLREALFRDAVVSYAKPFSDNRGVFARKGLRISEKGIPSELKPAHVEIIRIRDKLFAHMDLDVQKPELSHFDVNGETHHSFTVTGYGKVFSDHLVEPLGKLAKAVHTHLMQELKFIETGRF